ncbi:protein stum homolog [Watersipora subatra]|uniref:protein stum homolog n=1 Tax=Watersipora subatra TaxID=2589382 RepID=UPI00355BBB23
MADSDQSNSAPAASEEKPDINQLDVGVDVSRKEFEKISNNDPLIERMQPGVATGRYEVMVKEKKGFFGSAIPEKLPCCVAVLLCFFNCVVPGLGTLISAPFSLCAKDKTQKKKLRNFGVNLLAAFLQMVTTPLLLIGWLWSIMWAIEFLKPLKGDGFEFS